MRPSNKTAQRLIRFDWNMCVLLGDPFVAAPPILGCWSARAVVVVDNTVTDAELKRMHGLGARGIRFNLAQASDDT